MNDNHNLADKALKIVAAFDSFKGSIGAARAGELFARAVEQLALPAKVINIPLADGGEGTIEVLRVALKGSLIKCRVSDPLNRPIEAAYLAWADCGLIEMAQASGLTLLKPEERNPFITTTYGTGDLIRDAVLTRKIKKLYISLGGSATNDGGIGVLQAIGVLFLDKHGNRLEDPIKDMEAIARLDTSKLAIAFRETEYVVLTDVDNPLLGESGATRVFAPQKGARQEELERLEKRLASYAQAVEASTNTFLSQSPGAGAAGGLGFGLRSILGAKQELGINSIMQALNFDKNIAGASLVVTGEGCLDAQSVRGKVVSGVLAQANKANIPCVALVGSIRPGYEALYKQGLTTAVASVAAFMTEEYALKNAEALFLEAAIRFLRTLVAGMALATPKT